MSDSKKLLQEKILEYGEDYGEPCSFDKESSQSIDEQYEYARNKKVGELWKLIDGYACESKVEAARHIQGHLMADEPEVVASNRSEEYDNAWFKGQLVFSNYINDEVIEPYIFALENPDKLVQEPKRNV